MIFMPISNLITITVSISFPILISITIENIIHDPHQSQFPSFSRSQSRLEYVGPCSRTRAQCFPIRTDLGRRITCLYFSMGHYFIRNFCVDFLLRQFHTVCVRLTFLKVCFLRLDNKIHFRYDSCHDPNP